MNATTTITVTTHIVLGEHAFDHQTYNDRRVRVTRLAVTGTRVHGSGLFYKSDGTVGRAEASRLPIDPAELSEQLRDLIAAEAHTALQAALDQVTGATTASPEAVGCERGEPAPGPTGSRTAPPHDALAALLLAHQPTADTNVTDGVAACSCGQMVTVAFTTSYSEGVRVAFAHHHADLIRQLIDAASN